MKVVHFCLSCFFIDGWAYQENQLVAEHVRNGHDVLVVASPESLSKENKPIYLTPSTYFGAEGARVVRLGYQKGMSQSIAAKLRMHPGVRAILDDFKPDAIMFHGTCGWELLTVASYVEANPNCIFYIDSHEDRHNSARGFVSREILHKLYYKTILQRALPFARKVLCYSTESMQFCEETYGLPKSKIEFFPLGGMPIEEPEYTRRRTAIRTAWGVTDKNIVLVQSGKQNAAKKLQASLEAIAKIDDPNLRLFIAGTLAEEDSDKVTPLIDADDRVTYLGWQEAQVLEDMLCGADVYLQPGTQSVTFQQSLCCHCAVIVDDTPAHHPFVRDNGWLVRSDSGLVEAIGSLGTADLKAMQDASFEIALELLDYRRMAKRVLT